MKRTIESTARRIVSYRCSVWRTWERERDLEQETKIGCLQSRVCRHESMCLIVRGAVWLVVERYSRPPS